jgi:hypothetical protein
MAARGVGEKGEGGVGNQLPALPRAGVMRGGGTTGAGAAALGGSAGRRWRLGEEGPVVRRRLWGAGGAPRPFL